MSLVLSRRERWLKRWMSVGAVVLNQIMTFSMAGFVVYVTNNLELSGSRSEFGSMHNTAANICLCVKTATGSTYDVRCSCKV